MFVSLVFGLGLEHFCPWPRECLFSEELSLALASDFFCVLGLGLEPYVLNSSLRNTNFCENYSTYLFSSLEKKNKVQPFKKTTEKRLPDLRPKCEFLSKWFGEVALKLESHYFNYFRTIRNISTVLVLQFSTNVAIPQRIICQKTKRISFLHDNKKDPKQIKYYLMFSTSIIILS